MEKIYVSKVDEVYLYIEASLSQSMELKEHFSYYIANYKYHPKFKMKAWDGRISLYKWNSGLLPVGLYKELIKFGQKFNYEIIWDIPLNEMYTDISDEEIEDFYKVIFKDSKFHPRDYQDDAIHRVLKKRRGIIESPTASGKSLIIYCIIRFLLALDKKILLVVPNIALTEQMYSDFEEYGWKNCQNYVSVLHGKSKKYKEEPKVLCSTWQSIYKRKKDFFEDYDAVIIDEVHGAKAYNYQKILEKCSNADYRIGLTGTLQEQQCDKMAIIGHLGPVLFSLTAGELIDKGILSKITIANMLLQYTPEEVDYMKRRPYPEEERFIAEHEGRNKVFKFITKNVGADDNILILVRLRAHLHAVRAYLHEKFPQKEVHEIYGETDVDVRESLRKGTNEKSGVILVATYATMSQGINIKRLHHVIFGSSYKSKIRILQSIGRGLRKHESKQKLILWDIVDDLRYVKRTGNIGENHVFGHFKDRLRYYKQQGFSYVNKKVFIEKL